MITAGVPFVIFITTFDPFGYEMPVYTFKNICKENTEMKGVTSPDQYCMLCYIQKVMKVGKNIKIAFKPIAPIQQLKLCDKRNAMFFGLNMDCAITDLNHSAWSVRKVNVFEAFKEAGIPGIPMPV